MKNIYYTTVFVNSNSEARDINQWNEKLQSILQQIPFKEERVKPIIQFLVVTISPSKIYMLRDKDSQQSAYIDLLLIIPSKSEVSFTELEPILDICLSERSACKLFLA